MGAFYVGVFLISLYYLVLIATETLSRKESFVTVYVQSVTSDSYFTMEDYIDCMLTFSTEPKGKGCIHTKTYKVHDELFKGFIDKYNSYIKNQTPITIKI